MILGMVSLGGITRLTGSGLSIVEWKPIVGIFPPFSESDWGQEFLNYQGSPEFQKINFTMSLSDFKSIFWLEYLHRLWGRLLGIVLLIPTFLIFLKKGYRTLWPLIVILWLLGGAQGLMGWWMVKSGLIHDPHVSPYRLATHLLLGFAIFGVSFWATLRVYKEKLIRKGISLSPFLKGLLLLAMGGVLITAFMGALVAGLKAGLLYNTFPLMGDRLIPHEILTQSPWWRDFLENPVSVQFLHRTFALTTALFCGSLWVYQRYFSLSKSIFYGFTVMALAACFQVVLGIGTLIYQVPLFLAAFHQVFAFLLFGSLLYVYFCASHLSR